jgi:hypothetical protein
MERNRELFYKIAERIEKEPKLYVQGHWAALVMDVDDPKCPFDVRYIDGVDDVMEYLKWPRNDDQQDTLDTMGPEDVPEHSCGTAYCIAGHAMALSGWKTEWRLSDDGDGADLVWINPKGRGERDVYFVAVAAELLGILDPETGQYDRHVLGVSTNNIFNAGWHPREGLTVPEALRMLGDGATYEDVTYEWPEFPARHFSGNLSNQVA